MILFYFCFKKATYSNRKHSSIVFDGNLLKIYGFLFHETDPFMTLLIALTTNFSSCQPNTVACK